MVCGVMFDRDERFGSRWEEVAVCIPSIFVLCVHGMVRNCYMILNNKMEYKDR